MFLVAFAAGATCVQRTSGNIKTTAKQKHEKYQGANVVSLDLGGSALLLTPEICRALLMACPKKSDVNYKPGVDVNGKAVVGADFNPSSIKLPEKIRIPVYYSKVSRFTESRIRPTTAVDGAFSSQFIDEIPLGFIDYELKDGLIAFNGQKLTEKESSLFRQKCQDILALEK